MANPRNAAAGSLRQLDPKMAAAQRGLDIVIFNIQLTDGRPLLQHRRADSLDYLEKPPLQGHSPTLAVRTCDEVQAADRPSWRLERYDLSLSTLTEQL